jgi:UDP-GlcNAc:undecaprenyl-phosphate GlcNAc-1-phosphate transferase
MVWVSIIGFLVSGLLLIALMPWIRRLSLRIGAVSVPNERSMHTKVMPQLGGLAIFLSFLLTALLLYPFAKEQLSPFIGILASALIIEIVGIIDDKYALSAKWKMAGQMVAAIVVVLFGVTIDQVHIPFGDTIFFPDWVSIPLTIIWIVGVINAVNWIDGLDGLASGVAGIAIATMIVIALLTGNLPVLLLGAILLGSVAGFLIFNFEPAKIFMGESGAGFLGFMLATVSIFGFKQAIFVSFIIPIIILGVPLFDTMLAMLRRSLNRKPLYIADRQHLHHSLVGLGLSRKSTVFVMYLVSAFFGACAIILTKASTSGVTTVLLMLLIVLVLLAGAEVVGIAKERKPILQLMRKIKIKQTEKP